MLGQKVNIFVLDKDPCIAAQQQCNKHCVKMILESAQMLCTAVNFYGGTSHYRPTHKNHPCTKWARETKSNFNWLKKHALSLCEEYTERYGKVHKCEPIIREISNELIPDGGLTSFAQAMPEQYRDSDPVKAYRSYYKGEKSHIAVWPENKQPSWW